MTLYLLQYKNYYNRKADKFDTIDEYPTPLATFQGVVNWNPNDGVRTEQIINYNGDMPDYLVVCENDAASTINSRWYITESARTRNGQFKLSLLRDVVADWWDEIITAPAFVEKGYIDINDGAIFNDENVLVSQIKVGETLLKDRTGSGWVVGYYAAPNAEEGDTTTITYGTREPVVDFSASSLDTWAYLSRVRKVDDTEISTTAGTKYATELKYGFVIQHSGSTSQTIQGYYNQYGKISSTTNGSGTSNLSAGAAYFTKIIDAAYGQIPFGFESDIRNYYGLEFDANTDPSGGLTDANASFNALKRMNGKTLRVGTGENAEYYTITTVTPDAAVQNPSPASYIKTNFATWMDNINTKVKEDTNTSIRVINGDYATANAYRLSYKEHVAYLTLSKITPNTGLSFTITKTRRQLEDAPWCMFCMPYGDDYYVNLNKTIKQNAIQIASGFFTSAGSNVYDIQLLPYCPIERVRERGNYFNIASTDLVEHIDYELIPESSQILFWANSSTGSFNIDFSRDIDTDSIMFKANMLTKFMRFVSPNGNGIFEFNKEKNYGIDYINVDYAYKPYTPYIHLNPNFKGLYGNDYNDSRGLILGGDFSLSSTSNAWTEYQIQNKNYQVMFDRGIEKMGVERKYQRGMEIANAITSSVGTSVQAGMAFSTGGPLAAGIAAGAAGTLSLGAGIADVVINEKLYKIGLDYTKDMFGFQNQNIQAVPNSITKVSSLNPNNKIFPFVEEYECTEQEYEAVYNKLFWNGFTINRIGKLTNFIGLETRQGADYIKGQIIRLDGLADDYHVAQAIASEINQGVYV